MKRLMMTAGIVLTGLALAAAHLDAQEKAASIPDRDLGLSKGPVGDVADPPPALTNRSEPGDRPATPADFADQPPVVPHGVADFLPITRDDNQCMDCHVVEEKLEGEPTPIPASHYTDLRNAPEEVGAEVVGARYHCVSCHVSPGEDELLVKNGYRSAR